MSDAVAFDFCVPPLLLGTPPRATEYTTRRTEERATEGAHQRTAGESQRNCDETTLGSAVDHAQAPAPAPALAQAPAPAPAPALAPVHAPALNSYALPQHTPDAHSADAAVAAAMDYAAQVREVAERALAQRPLVTRAFLRALRAEDRCVSADELRAVLRFASWVLETVPPTIDVDALGDDDLWSTAVELGVIGPLAQPDARLVLRAVQEASSVEQIERVMDAAFGLAPCVQGVRKEHDLVTLLQLQSAREAAMALVASK